MSTPFAADYPFLEILGTMVLFFAWITWIWMMVVLLTDVFRRRDIGGWTKAAWCLFMIVLPFIGALVYVGVQHDGIAERGAKEIERRESRHQFRMGPGAPGAGDPAGMIENGERLLARGTITDAEFDALKAKALATH